ncbi:MAG: glycosyltransferase [Bacteroidetes bacterium]|nr:glycosyltransferase [Bacteroidota bacterium]
MPPVPVPQIDGLAILLFIFIFLFILLNLYYWCIFFRLAWSKEKPVKPGQKGVSVVICARNEYFHLKENLSFILEQDYPDFEVIVVNHASDDDSAFLLAHMAEQYPNLKIVEIRENLNFFTGKKFPLSIGIKSAKKEIVLLTDADCRPWGKNWISEMQKQCSSPVDIVLGYGSYEHKPGFLNKLIRFDTAQVAIQYLSFALAGMPYMGVGRNMGYRKSLFYENQGFISHYAIDSGDDDLFINRVANKTNTRVCLMPESFTVSEPKTNFSYWIRQKKRHLSTGQFYKFKHKLMLGTFTVSQWLFVLLFSLLLIMDYNILPVLSLFFVRMVIQMFVFKRCMSRLKEKKIWLFVPLFELIFLCINTSVLVSNLISKPVKWK